MGTKYQNGGGVSPWPADCFVATACYGVDDKITESLRIWRDKIRNKKFGFWLVKLYYAGIGKAGGKLLNHFTVLKPMARIAIKVFVIVFGIKK